MTGFSPLASSTLADDGGVSNYQLVASNVATQPASVPSTSLTQDHDLGVVSFITGSPLLQTTSLTQDHSITSVSLAFGTPVLGSPSITQEHSLLVTDLITGTPELANLGVTQNYDLSASSFVVGSPTVSDVTLVEDETFSLDNLELGVPLVGNVSLLQEHNLTALAILTPFPNLGEPVDPNAIVVQEIKEIEQMFGGWPRRAYEVPDGRLVQAEREIEALTGDRVSIDRKAKSLIKFGKSADLTADTLETVWTVGGNETYVTDNTIEYISSSSALDTQTIKLECHTVSGTGTDSKFTFLVQEVTLDGQNPVALDTPVARVSHAYNSNGTEIVGRVTVYENTTVVGGVPSDPSKIHIDIPQGLQGSFKGATTFSDSDYYVLTGGFGSVSKKQDANVDFYLEVREAGGVFIQRAAVSASTGGPWDIDLDPAVIVPKNADVRIRADSGTNNAVVFGVFKGYLAKVLG